MLLRILAPLMLLVLLAGCSTALKRAQKLLDEGLYEEAVTAYNDILAKDPKEEDAIIGLKKARELWIDRRLIDVRQQRMAGNAAQGLERMLEVVQKEKEWGLAPGGKVAFTQGEEREYAVRYSEREVHRALEAKHPLEAHVLLNHLAPIIEAVPDPRVVGLRAATQTVGADSCKPLLSSAPYASKPNLDLILRNYCELWGVTQWPALPPKSLQAPYTYGSLDVQDALEGFRPDAVVYVRDQLRKTLEASASYQPGWAHSLALPLKGQYREEQAQSTVARTQVYSEQVPYQANVKVERTRSVPYTESVGGKLVTQYRSEKYTDWVAETRYRTVYKEYAYQVVRRDQKLALTLQGRFSFDGAGGQIARDERSEAFGFEHNENHPAIGLRPERPGLPAPDAWVRAQADALAAAFAARLAELWDDRFCGIAPSNSGLLEGGEAVALCLRQKHPKAPEFTQQWFRTHFGVGAEVGIAALHYRL